MTVTTRLCPAISEYTMKIISPTPQIGTNQSYPMSSKCTMKRFPGTADNDSSVPYAEPGIHDKAPNNFYTADHENAVPYDELEIHDETLDISRPPIMSTRFHTTSLEYTTKR